MRHRMVTQARAVRTRIAAWVVLLTALALVGAGVAAYLVETDRIDERIAHELGNEIEQFDAVVHPGHSELLAGQRVNAQPPTSAVQAMRQALLRNVPPDNNETIVAFVNGDPVMMAGGTLPRYQGLIRDPAFVQAVRDLLPGGGSQQLETRSHGEVVMAVQPVNDADGSTHGAYVPVFFPEGERAQFVAVMRTYALVAGLALLLVSVGAWMVSDRLLQPLRQMRATAQEISHTDLSRRIDTTGNDDLTDLGNTFNAMLDRLEHSFAQQRRFLDDAGHELRTPITIVRGHLELLDPEHVPDTLATRDLVLDEVDRMARLVDDMIVLAKSGRPDFLRPVDVDAGELTDEVLDKVRALGDRAWKLDERAEGTVRVDPQRVTQALLQLATNATQHTEAGDVIALGSASEGGVVRWWVRDTGPGVHPADADRIFERFQRGDHARGSEGSGLGLSIVRAIANAHGGEVSLDSTPGEGATFTLVLPAGGAHTVETHDDRTEDR